MHTHTQTHTHTHTHIHTLTHKHTYTMKIYVKFVVDSPKLFYDHISSSAIVFEATVYIYIQMTYNGHLKIH